jgi:NUMOD1 domain-containing protein
LKESVLERCKEEEYLARLSAAQSTGKAVEVTDLILGTKTSYHAIRAAAKALDIDKRYIENYLYLDKKTPVFGRYTFTEIGEAQRKIHSQPSISIEVEDLESNEKTVYSSISLAARALGVRQASISTYLSKERTLPFKRKYIIKKLGEYDTEVLDKESTIYIIEVTDLTNPSEGGNKTNYFSVFAASKALNIPESTLRSYLTKNTDKPYKGKYIFKKIEYKRN